MTRRNDDYNEWLEMFCEEKSGQGLAEASISSYRFSVRKYLNFLDGKGISKQSFYSFVNSLDVGPTSKVHYARDLRCFLYWLQEEGLLPEFKVSLPKAQDPMPKIVSAEDVSALLKRDKRDFFEDRIYTVICLILSTGLRARTITNILVEDLDLDSREITIRETKSKKVTVLPVTDKLFSILSKYIKRWDLGIWMFPQGDGEKMQSEGLQSAYKRYARKRGVKYGLHALRHYYATESIKRGMTPFALQRILGHSDISVTMKYVNLVNRDLSREMEKVSLL